MSNGMEEVTIYRFQLEAIAEALRLTSNIHHCRQGKTCHDRVVRQADEYANNALKGNKDLRVNYATGKTE